MVAIQPDALRGRGRPRTERNLQRGRLLQAAGELLSDPHGGDLALRQVALRAGVTPALAHYYFANREGLLAALLDERVAPPIDALLATTQSSAGQPVAALTRLMQRLVSLVATDPLLRRCLLLPSAQPLRERLRAALRDLLQDAQHLGLLRADLPPDYLADTLLGLCLFPFMDADKGIDPAERAAALTLQHVALLQDGIVGARKPATRGT